MDKRPTGTKDLQGQKIYKGKGPTCTKWLQTYRSKNIEKNNSGKKDLQNKGKRTRRKRPTRTEDLQKKTYWIKNVLCKRPTGSCFDELLFQKPPPVLQCDDCHSWVTSSPTKNSPPQFPREYQQWDGG